MDKVDWSREQPVLVAKFILTPYQKSHNYKPNIYFYNSTMLYLQSMFEELLQYSLEQSEKIFIQSG